MIVPRTFSNSGPAMELEELKSDPGLRAPIPGTSRVTDASPPAHGYFALPVPPDGLPEWLSSGWRSIQRQNTALWHPYFSPGFTLAAARSRSDTWVAIRMRDHVPVAILPCQRLNNRVAIPVGGAINDYHGVLAVHEEDVDPMPLLESLRVRRFDFHSWSWPRGPVARWAVSEAIPDSSAELGTGCCLAELAQNSTTVRKQGQKTRKMVREIGPLRFEFDDCSRQSLEWLIGLKREKYRRTGCRDFFQPEWSRRLVGEIQQTRTAGFSGILSVLYAGDQPVAGHFGMTANNILHFWYPAFDRKFEKYSPGTELYLQVAREAQSRGFQRIDFGYGFESFKLKLANRFGRLSCGTIGASALERAVGKAAFGLRSSVQKSPFRGLLRNSIRFFWPEAGKPQVR